MVSVSGHLTCEKVLERHENHLDNGNSFTIQSSESQLHFTLYWTVIYLAIFKLRVIWQLIISRIIIIKKCCMLLLTRDLRFVTQRKPINLLIVRIINDQQTLSECSVESVEKYAVFSRKKRKHWIVRVIYENPHSDLIYNHFGLKWNLDSSSSTDTLCWCSSNY